MPPLMQFDNLVAVSWHHDMLPDFLWIALMLGRRSDWRAVYRPLDIVDQFVPKGPRFVDGRLTTFGLVPEASRAEVRNLIESETPHALPTALGHALGLYPTCPALWLYEDWLSRNEPDPAVGLPLLRALVAENSDKAGVMSTRLRMAAFSRRVKHGRFSHTGEGVMSLFPEYPHLSEADRRAVESAMRAMWGSFHGIEAAEDPTVAAWSRTFWARSRELTPCQFEIRSGAIPMTDGPDGPVDPEPMTQLSELRVLLVSVRTLGDRLRTAQLAAFGDPATDEPTSVLLGLASRMFRLLSDFLDRPSAWAPGTAAYHLRPIVETRIVSAWLTKRDDASTFAAYREHGLGHLKLLRDHIRADFGEDLDQDAKELLESLDRRVNLEIDEWFQPVNVGSFTKVTVRQMAIDCDLKRLYDLSFVPLSSENHGEWPSVRENDTVLCTDPLHGGHRIGAFQGSSRIIAPPAARTALTVAEEGITSIFGRYGIDVSPDFAPVWTAFNAAMYEDETGDAEIVTDPEGEATGDKGESD